MRVRPTRRSEVVAAVDLGQPRPEALQIGFGLFDLFVGCAIAVALGLRFLPRAGRQTTDPLDYRGLLLMATGLPLLTYGLAEIGATGKFTSPKVVYPIIASIFLIGGFIWHALRIRNPLLDLRLYRKPTFSSASFAMFCLGAALFGGMILLPLYWQGIRHESVVDTGLLTAPQGLGMAMMMPLAGKLTDRFGGGPLALLGVIVTTLATVPFGLISATSSVFWLSVAMFLPSSATVLAAGARTTSVPMRPSYRRMAVLTSARRGSAMRSPPSSR